MTFSGKSFLLTICGILFSLSLAAQRFNICLSTLYSTAPKLSFLALNFDYTRNNFSLGLKTGTEDVLIEGFRNFRGFRSFYAGIYGGSRVVFLEQMSLVPSFGFGYFSPVLSEEKGSLYEGIDLGLRYGKEDYYEIAYTGFFLQNKEHPNYHCIRFSIGLMF